MGKTKIHTSFVFALNSAMEQAGWTQDDLAKAMKVSRLTINQLLGDKRQVTINIAQRLGWVFKTSSIFWWDLYWHQKIKDAERTFISSRLKLIRAPRGKS